MKYDQRRNWFSNLSLIEVMEERISKTRELRDILQRENNLRITWLRETNRKQRTVDRETLSDSEPRNATVNNENTKNFNQHGMPLVITRR